MAETHQAELVGDRTHKITVEDPESLQSAKLFKHVSDAVWDRHPDNYDWSVLDIQSVLPADEAISTANEVAAGIDEKLVLADGNKDLKLGSMRGEKIIISASELVTPESASIETYNWDERFTGRQILVAGEHNYAAFTDGHLDYARELGAKFRFVLQEPSVLVVSYAMQRYQYGQGKPTTLHSHVWYSKFAETGYEGDSLHSVELTEAQETDMLKVIAKMGNIGLEGFEA